MSSRPRVFSGIQPTADSFHLGNYLGADTPVGRPPGDARGVLLRGGPARDHRAPRTQPSCASGPGSRPRNCSRPGSTRTGPVVFVQSHVPQHPELAWVLGCLTGFGEASRMTQFKDKAAKGGAQQASLGLFSYPVLQAADILLYRPTRCRSARTSASISSSGRGPRSSGSTIVTGPRSRCPRPCILSGVERRSPICRSRPRR